MTAAGGDAKAWYLVYTKPRQEGVAQANLERQGYAVYLPRVRQLRRRLGRAVENIEPLFPRYLFIQLSTHTDNWAPIRSTLGVSSLVRFGPLPEIVPTDLIAALRARETEDGLQPLEDRGFEAGQAVRIESGPLEGYEGIFLVKSGRDRVMVLLDILGKRTRVTVNRDDLEGAR